MQFQYFKYNVRYVTSSENIADALSRLTKIPASKGYVLDEENVGEVNLQEVPAALRVAETEEVSFREKKLKLVSKALETGRLSKAPKAYEPLSHELTRVGQVVLQKN